jgi:hypothetical protein
VGRPSVDEEIERLVGKPDETCGVDSYKIDPVTVRIFPFRFRFRDIYTKINLNKVAPLRLSVHNGVDCCVQVKI